VAEHIAGPLYWEELGKHGLPLVFAHASPDDRRFWMYQTAHFSAWFRTIAIDLPGFGHSPEVLPGMSLDEVGWACWEAVDAVTQDKAILQGSSLGAEVVLQMVNQRPERTLALILSSNGYIPGREFAARWISAYSEGGVATRREQLLGHFSPEARDTPFVQYYIDMITETNRADASSIVETYRALSQPPPDTLYRGVAVPTLIITATGDRNHPAAKTLQGMIAGAEIGIIEGAGHHCNLEQPWKFDEYVMDFLARHGLFAEHGSAMASRVT